MENVFTEENSKRLILKVARYVIRRKSRLFMLLKNLESFRN